MKIRVIAVSGSPRRGNTEILLDKALEGCRERGAETEFAKIRELGISQCCGRQECYRERRCNVEGGLGGLFEKLLAADAWLLGTPNYFNNVSGLMKNFMDRTNPYSEGLEFRGKKAGLITIGGHSMKSIGVAENALKEFCRIHRIRVVGSVKALADAPKEVLKNKKALRSAFGLGRKIAIAARKGKN